MPDRSEFPDAVGGLMHSIAWPERKVSHGVAILVKDRLPIFVISTPSVNDQEIEIVPAPMQNNKAKSFCLERVASQIRAGQLIDLIRHRLVF